VAHALLEVRYVRDAVDDLPNEVDELAGGVDFRLNSGFGLSQHGGCIQRRPVLSRHQVRRLHPNINSLRHGRLVPDLLGFRSSAYCLFHKVWTCVVVTSDASLMVVGLQPTISIYYPQKAINFHRLQ